MTKKTRKLIIFEYASGIVGKGNTITKIVKSVFTPKQYENRYYRSNEHFRTEYAIDVYELKK